MKTLGVVVLVVLLAEVAAMCSNSRCIRSCKGLPSGKYQSCKGCRYFAACYHGHGFIGACYYGYSWDDFFKRCQKKSSTCPQPKNQPCITNCSGIPDGVYQSCKSCDVYTVCHHGDVHTKSCDKGTYWDDVIKRCRKASLTCKKVTVPDRCISDCEGKSDGDYQSCIGCDVYASCVSNSIYDNRTCPADLVWDDFYKRCEYNSSTCPTTDDSPCMSNCTGQPGGRYQSCKSCDTYVTCCNGHLLEDKCPHGTMWDDSLKRCEKTSKTCRENTTFDDERANEPTSTDSYPCVTDCTGEMDGVYQYCKGCDKYINCFEGKTTFVRCAGKTVWDDSLKRCREVSLTCPRLSTMLELR